MNATAIFAAGREDAMTDFQFRAIMAMVLDMLKKCKTLDDVEETMKMIAKLSGELAPQDTDER